MIDDDATRRLRELLDAADLRREVAKEYRRVFGVELPPCPAPHTLDPVALRDLVILAAHGALVPAQAHQVTLRGVIARFPCGLHRVQTTVYDPDSAPGR